MSFVLFVIYMYAVQKEGKNKNKHLISRTNRDFNNFFHWIGSFGRFRFYSSFKLLLIFEFCINALVKRSPELCCISHSFNIAIYLLA